MSSVNRVEELASLIERVAEGDASALAAFYDSTSRLVFGLILGVVGNRFVAEEVIVDVYKQVWQKAAAYRADQGAPLAWLMSLARARAAKYAKSGRLVKSPPKHGTVSSAAVEKAVRKVAGIRARSRRSKILASVRPTT